MENPILAEWRRIQPLQYFFILTLIIEAFSLKPPSPWAIQCSGPPPPHGWPHDGPSAEDYPSLGALCLDNPIFPNLDCACSNLPWQGRVACNSENAAEELDDHLELILWCEDFCYCLGPELDERENGGRSGKMVEAVQTFLQNSKRPASRRRNIKPLWVYHDPPKVIQGLVAGSCRAGALYERPPDSLSRPRRCHHWPH